VKTCGYQRKLRPAISRCLAGLLGGMIVTSAALAGLQEGVEAYQRKDYTAALAEFMPLAKAGDPKAATGVATIYFFWPGRGEDYAVALRWYRSAAEAGQATAAQRLGQMYQNGFGVASDPRTALVWYRKAASLGSAGAMN